VGFQKLVLDDFAPRADRSGEESGLGRVQLPQTCTLGEKAPLKA